MMEIFFYTMGIIFCTILILGGLGWCWHEVAFFLGRIRNYEKASEVEQRLRHSEAERDKLKEKLAAMEASDGGFR